MAHSEHAVRGKAIVVGGSVGGLFAGNFLFQHGQMPRWAMRLK